MKDPGRTRLRKWEKKTRYQKMWRNKFQTTTNDEVKRWNSFTDNEHLQARRRKRTSHECRGNRKRHPHTCIEIEHRYKALTRRGLSRRLHIRSVGMQTIMRRSKVIDMSFCKRLKVAESDSGYGTTYERYGAFRKRQRTISQTIYFIPLSANFVASTSNLKEQSLQKCWWSNTATKRRGSEGENRSNIGITDTGFEPGRCGPVNNIGRVRRYYV